jgi:hypothetical protein
MGGAGCLFVHSTHNKFLDPLLIRFATVLAVMSVSDQMSSKVKTEHIEMFSF